jgi:hypothetical protein
MTMAESEQWSGQLTPEQLAEFEAEFGRSAWAQKLRELVVAYANQEGGQTLALMRLLHGIFWGEPRVLSFEQASQILNVPVSELMATYDRAMEVVRPLWSASPEYKEWQAARGSS